jgi:hypothetical protein
MPWSNGMVEGFVNPREVDQTQFLRTGGISAAATPRAAASGGFGTVQQRSETTLFPEVCISSLS